MSLLLSSCSFYRRPAICEVSEQFITKRDAALNVDSVAVWHGPKGQHWLIATAKSANVLPVYDAATGAWIKNIGQPGTEAGQLLRPNGIAVSGNILFVIERDNARMQLFSLPEGTPLGMTEGILKRPYGLAVTQTAPGDYTVYITDNYSSGNYVSGRGVPSPKKVHIYRVFGPNDLIFIDHRSTFGDEEGPGVLYKVESIAADPLYNRLFIADEHRIAKNIKIYTLDGQFTGHILGAGLFMYEPEGIACYCTSAKAGYIIATDQDRRDNRFYLFDRETLKYIKTFRGHVVRNTDGIAVTERSFGPFARGAFYAVHDDGNICAYDWREISKLCALP
jgi:3-phytase